MKPEDLPRVFEESEKIYKLLNTKIGMYKRFYAIAHPQVEAEDPLRFFVLNNKTDEFKRWPEIVIINPVVLRHTNMATDSEEGCASLSTMPVIAVQRWTKCEVEFTPLQFDKENNPIMGKRKTMNLSGKAAKVFQHEQDHLDAKYIYKT